MQFPCVMMEDMTMAQIMSLLPVGSELTRMLRRNKILATSNYDAFIELLYEDIDICTQQMQKNPQLRKNDTEDRLTEDINSQLERMGYEATHDTSAGGHVDITVKLGTLTWVGEAKKDQKFIEGFKQLTTRYRPASGNPKHSSVGLIFYLVKTGNVVQQLGAWRQKMADEFLPGYKTRDCPRNPFAFYSEHIGDWSGLPVQIRHMMVCLYHDPKDASGRNRKGKTKAPAKGGASKTAPTV